MATRYFKKPNEREVCTTSSGNRSRVLPDTPGYPYDWIEIERKEFIKLRRKIVSGTTSRSVDWRKLRNEKECEMNKSVVEDAVEDIDIAIALESASSCACDPEVGWVCERCFIVSTLEKAKCVCVGFINDNQTAQLAQ